MKHTITLIAMLLCSMSSMAQQERILPSPQFPASALQSLSDVVSQRRSIREYSDRKIDDATLSCLLWAACGVSEQTTGKITAPSAMNKQDIIVYVCAEDGAYLYDAKKHGLTLVSTKDLRKPLAGSQRFAATAPVNLLLVSRTRQFPRRGLEYGCMDAGYVSQNIYLASTALGLGTVARATMDSEVLVKELNLKEGEAPILNHPVGFLKD